jgi:hypothetical protein
MGTLDTRGLTRGRFGLRMTGAGQWEPFDTWGGYFISWDLWDRWRAERRVDWANHDFRFGEHVEEEGIDEQWGRRKATCGRCGEERLIWRGVPEGDRALNDGWCVPTFWQRLLRGAP